MIRIKKQVGETPLDALERFRREHPDYESARLSYAGRLDPMAEGELLLLKGEENDRRDEFLGLDKTYEFQMLCGVSTDSFDLLGLVENVQEVRVGKKEIKKALSEFKGEWQMQYPPYSSKTVDHDGQMTPLWQLARAEKLPDQLPTKKVEIYDAEVMSTDEITGEQLLKEINRRVAKVEGDFRQSAIIDQWQSALEKDMKFSLIKNYVRCSAGTYVRRLADEVGAELGAPACTFSIKRTSISACESA